MVALLPPASTTMPVPLAQYTNKQLNIANLLYLATLGGAEVCNLSTRIGSFEPGKSFDALLVSMAPENSHHAGVWYEEGSFAASEIPSRKTLEAHLERFLFCGDDRNISKVFVQGRCIGGTTLEADPHPSIAISP